MDDLKQMLRAQGASLVGFAALDGLYEPCDLTQPRTVDSQTKPFDIPRYPTGIAIAVAIARDTVRALTEQPTMAYYDAYHTLNDRLDALAECCANALVQAGYHAYAQTTKNTKEYGIFRTILPHKTVAVHAGLGWIGKSALLVTPEYGGAVRLTSVLTDAPLAPDTPSVQSRCGDCLVCHHACPADAIRGTLPQAGASRETFFDAMACRIQARKIAAQTLQKEITLCGKCIAVCPYTRRYLDQT